MFVIFNIFILSKVKINKHDNIKSEAFKDDDLDNMFDHSYYPHLHPSAPWSRGFNV